MSAEQKLNDRNFEEEVIRSKLPVLVDFWSSWCPPCKVTEPLINELAQEYAGKVKIGTINVDQNHVTASKFEIRGIPTFILFASGEETRRKVGAQSKGQLREMLDTIL